MIQLTTEQIDAMFKRVFEEHHEGRIILEVLIRQFGHAKPAVEGGIDAVLKTYRAMGNREVVDNIVLRINRANGVNDQPDEENPHE